MALIGAGFIGAEVASTCVERGLSVTVIERENMPFSRSLGAAVGAELNALYVSKGVDMRAGRSVSRLLGDEAVTGVELDDGAIIDADIVVLSVAVVPDPDGSKDRAFRSTTGSSATRTCRWRPASSRQGMSRAGRTVARRFRRVEHWEHAITSGEHAARTLLGKPDPYDIIPWVWSDQFGFKLQFVGSSIDHDEVIVDSSLDTDGRMLALYRKGDRLLGACGIRRNKAVLSLRATVGQPGSWAAAIGQLAVGAAA